MTDLKISLNPIVVFIWSPVGGTDKLSPTCDKMDLVFSCSSYSSCVWLPFSKSDFLQCRVQAQLAYLSPAGRQNCKPWSERPQSARADYKSWNNDWSSSILGFRCKKFSQNCVHQLCSSCWSAKLHLKQKVTKFWLHGCTFDHLSSFLPWRTASVIFYSRGPNCNQNSTVSELLSNCWILYF